MTNSRHRPVRYYIERLQSVHNEPEVAVAAIVTLGRRAQELRPELDDPGHLGAGDGQAAVTQLTLALWNSNQEIRDSAAWSCGQLGGLNVARQLLHRLHRIYVKRDVQEKMSTQATLVAALEQALDSRTVKELKGDDHRQLRDLTTVWQEWLTSASSKNPELETTLAYALSRLIIRVSKHAPYSLSPRLLSPLLQTGEPIATLAAVGSVHEQLHSELERIRRFLNSPNDANLPSELALFFSELSEKRGRSYTGDEIRKLCTLALQYWAAQQDVKSSYEPIGLEIEKNVFR